MNAVITKPVLSYLRFWAKKALEKHEPIIIGIAGSVGKSSTRNAIEAILKDHFPIKSVGNSETGIPLGILGMRPDNYTKAYWLKMLTRAPIQLDFLKGTKFLIAEMGIDDPYPPKNMAYLLTILKPEIAVSLNVSATHTMQFEKVLTDKEKQAPDEEKKEILLKAIAADDTKIMSESDCQTAIYNADDHYITNTVEAMLKKRGETSLLSFGEKSTNSISFGEYKVTLEGTLFTFFVRAGSDKRDEVSLHITDCVLPKEYREVFAAALLVGMRAGLTILQCVSALEKNYVLPKSRSTILTGINGTVIIDSSYNASKAATTAFLDLADVLKKETDRPIVFVFGDMRELGEEAQMEHVAVAEKAVGIVDYLYCVGPQTREFVLPVSQEHESSFKELRWFDNAKRIGEFLKDSLPKKAIVLVKGSQNTIYLEEAIKYILQNKADEKKLCRQDEYWLNLKGIKRH